VDVLLSATTQRGMTMDKRTKGIRLERTMFLLDHIKTALIASFDQSEDTDQAIELITVLEVMTQDDIIKLTTTLKLVPKNEDNKS